MNLSKLISFGYRDAIAIVNQFNDYFSKYDGAKVCVSFDGIANTLREFGDYRRTNYVDLKNPSSVSNFLFGFREHWYTRKNSKASLETRNSIWMMFRQMMAFCMQNELVATTAIPPGNKKLNCRNITREAKLLRKINSGDYIDNTNIIEIDLSRNDEEYLDELHKKFISVRDDFLSASLKEIEETKRLYTEGEKLAQSVCFKELLAKIAKDKISNRVQGANHLKPNHPNYLPNLLCYIKNKHDSLVLGYGRCGINLTHDSNLRYSFSRYVNKSIEADILSFYLGRLSARKLIPFFVYFLIKFPKLRVTSLLNLEIEEGADSKSSFSIVGESGGLIRIKTVKHRAHAKKSEVLDDESTDILELLIRMTTPFRNYLKKNNNPHYKRLFLKINGGDSFGNPSALLQKNISKTFGSQAHLIGSKRLSSNELATAKNSFLANHKQLEPYLGKVTPRQLPVIGGIITWFDTQGDAIAAAKVLGNTSKMTMDSYIPQPLQRLMNERLIRRFQNLLICASTADRDYMLEATDFRTQDELFIFLSQMLESDNVACRQSVTNILRSKLETKVPKQKTCIPAGDKFKQIKVSIEENSLAILFLYGEHVEKHLDIKGKNIDNIDESSPIFWKGLSDSLKIILPKNNTNRELVSIYESAISLVDNLRGKINFPNLMV